MEFYRTNCIQKLRLIRQTHACSALYRQFYAAMVGFPRAYSLTWQAWHVPVITSYELRAPMRHLGVQETGTCRLL